VCDSIGCNMPTEAIRSHHGSVIKMHILEISLDFCVPTFMLLIVLCSCY